MVTKMNQKTNNLIALQENCNKTSADYMESLRKSDEFSILKRHAQNEWPLRSL